MRSIKNLFILLFCCISLNLIAQEEWQIKITGFKLVENDLTATAGRYGMRDPNGDLCALIRVQTTARGFVFDNGSLGVVHVDESHPGEVWVYVPYGSRSLIIRHPTMLASETYYYPIAVESAKVYSMKINTPIAQEDKQIKITDFRLLENDLTATAGRYGMRDPNGDLCALIRVQTTARGFVFDNGMIGITHVDNSHPGEVWVYVPYGTRALTIRHPKMLASEKFYYPIAVERAKVYSMSIETPEIGKEEVLQRPAVPPLLNIVPGSIQFADASGNRAIDANEACKIVFKVSNTGKGAGLNCIAKVSTGAAGVNVSNKKLPNIPSGAVIDVEIPVTSSMETVNGEAIFNIEVYEPNGFGCDPVKLAVQAHAYQSPFVKVSDYAISGTPDGKIAKRSAFDLQLIVQNVDYGTAENVEVSISVPKDVWIMNESTNIAVGTLNGGATYEIRYEMMASNNYTAQSIPVRVNIREKHGKYAESKTINLPIGEKITNSGLISVEEVKQQRREEIRIAQIGNKYEPSDVDINIPRAATVNSRSFAVIIANENYKYTDNVEFALNDGNTFKEYCSTALGIPQRNIYLKTDATRNDIIVAMEWIANVMDSYNGQASVIFYYVGHGIPDEATGDAYLLPSDGIGNNATTGFKVSSIYEQLGSKPAKMVSVFIDACFSGAKRDGSSLVASRGVALKAKPVNPIQGNMVVFTAAQGDETAYPYKEKRHGLFTYYLLKKLQQSNGAVTFGELGSYINTQVQQTSVVINRKKQTPAVMSSPAVGTSWRELIFQ